MKKKQIVKFLKNSSNKFISKVFTNDPESAEKFRKTAFITGGCIPSLIAKEFLSDIDIYLTDKKFANYLADKFYNMAVDGCIEHTDHEMGYHTFIYSEDEILLLPTFISPHALSFPGKPKFQIMTSFIGIPEYVVKSFDWEHIKSFFLISTDTLYLTQRLYELVNDKQLIYTGSDYPLSSLLRTRKYIKKGWSISAKDIMLIALDIQKHDLSNKQILISQMAGIDPITILMELNRLSDEKMNVHDRIIEIMDIFNKENNSIYF